MMTHREKMVQIARALYNSTYVRAGLQQHYVKSLERLLNSDSDLNLSAFCNFDVKNDEVGTSISLHIETLGRFNVKEVTLDEEGNEYLITRFEAKVNYPTHGSTSIDVFKRRMEWMSLVAEEIRAIMEATAGEFKMIIRTKDDIEIDKRFKHEREQRIWREAAFNEARKNLRVNGTGRTYDGRLDDHPRVEVGIGNKTFSYYVKAHQLFVTRIA